MSFELPSIVGVAGGNGSGKTTFGRAREAALGVPYADLSDIIRIEAVNRGLDPTDRTVLRSISGEWARELNTPAVMARKALDYFGEGNPFTAVSIRRPAEAEFFQKRGGLILWVDAPVEQRWQNVNSRARDEGDQKTLDEFIEIENQEMYSKDPSDPYLINMSAVRDMADVTYINVAPSEEAAMADIARVFNFPDPTK